MIGGFTIKPDNYIEVWRTNGRVTRYTYNVVRSDHILLLTLDWTRLNFRDRIIVKRGIGK